MKRLGPTVVATITEHHLELVVDDWAGRPHNFCKPVAKTPADRDALRSVAVEGKAEIRWDACVCVSLSVCMCVCNRDALRSVTVEGEAEAR